MTEPAQAWKDKSRGIVATIHLNTLLRLLLQACLLVGPD
jgi:hypothetical protein